MAGTGSSSSSLTSTSHTLTHAPGMATAAATARDGSALSVFLKSIETANRHAFLQPTPLLPAGSLELARQTLDAFAGQVSDEQQLKLREAGKKRKREGDDKTEILKIRKLHVDGFETGQVWQQAKRIITSVLRQSKEALVELEENHAVQSDKVGVTGKEKAFDVDAEDVEDDSEEAGSESGSDIAESEEHDDSALYDPDAEDDVSGNTSESSQGREEGLEDESQLEYDEGESEGEDEDEDKGAQTGDASEPEQPSAEYVEDAHGLNDGFFSIDEFNKQAQWFEDQDARGDPNTDQVSDEEVDWHADPMATLEKKSRKASRKASRGKGKHDMEDDLDLDMDNNADESEDDGPTFGNMDLYAPEGASEDEDDQPLGSNLDDGLDLTANDVFYKDFFAPPPKKVKKGGGQKFRDLPQPSQPDEADIERAMDDVRRDLFDDVSDRSESDDALSDVEAGDPKSRRSAHERRQAKLAEEIRKLEAELVAKRAWTLSGEAAAVDRPVNSLLEEDLDFEHVGKPVPVVTEEVSESIETLIKRRILAQEFDEVLRRRPDSLGDPAGTRRGLVNVDDSKAKQSLAEIYEEEHVKKTNPDEYVSKADEKLRREEQEIERMWKEVSTKLDALSSWHYKPKPAVPTLTVVADVATITMEDVQPTTAQGVTGGESMLAPQEVYRADKETAERGEVVPKSGLPVARQEMTREGKLRLRRREKERIRKAGGTDATKKLGKKAQMQNDTIADLKKGGVTVINRKGERVDMDGKAVAGPKGPGTSGSYKL